MGYQVLARKWRPGKFAELVGQEHVVKAISSALDNNRLHHAYLFTGTRGVGKTTIARIFSRSLNCEIGISSNPCGQCASCVDIEKGNYVDLLEIDAASRTKVEDTREILDNVQYRPTRGEYKVYLIDEVHMLSKHSFNALLKTLEEPPPHVKFLLATTDPQKLPVTILSRCLQFNLKALTREQISGQLEHILTQEQIPFEKSALFQLAKSAQGSMRDALSLTDQAIAQGDGTVLPDIVADMLGLIDSDKITRVIDALLAQDKVAMMNISDELSLMGADYKAALADMMSLFHQVALTQFVPEACKLETNQARKIFDWAKTLPPEHVQLLYQIALQGKKELEWAQDAKSGFEMTLIRMLAFSPKLEVKPATEYKNLAAQQDVTFNVSRAGPAEAEKKTLDSEFEKPEVIAEPPISLRTDRDLMEQEQVDVAVIDDSPAIADENPQGDEQGIMAPSTPEHISNKPVKEEELSQEVNNIYAQAEQLTGRQDYHPPVDTQADLENQYYLEPVDSGSDEPQYFTPEPYYEEQGASPVPQAESAPVAQSETESTSYSSNTNELLALHSQLKTPPASNNTLQTSDPDINAKETNTSFAENNLAVPELHNGVTTEGPVAADNDLFEPDIIQPQTESPQSQETTSSVVENGVISDAVSHVSPVSDYQDDLYNTGAEVLVESEPERVNVPDDAEVEESSDSGPYFSAEGFLQEQHHEHSPQETQQRENQQQENVSQATVPDQVMPLVQTEDIDAAQEYLDAIPEAEYVPQSESKLTDVEAPQDILQSQDNAVPEAFDAYALPEWITFEQANAVSVDFEIPFKINGNKVLHASQLDTWSQLIEQSGIGALTKQLVLHSNYVKKGDVVELVVAEQQKHLLNEATMQTIEEALSETLQQKIKLQITVGEVIDTPWAVQRAINSMRQEHAEQTIQDDPVVAQICDHFSGTVIKETIKPR